VHRRARMTRSDGLGTVRCPTGRGVPGAGRCAW
jgi:hypothetical protein